MFLETLHCWLNENVHIVVTIDQDDKTMNNDQMLAHIRSKGCSVQIVKTVGKIAAMNYGIGSYDWDVFIMAQDDVTPIAGYDKKIERLFKKHFGTSTDGILHPRDGYRGDDLNTQVIMGREYFNRFGYAYHPSYKSLWADNEYTDVSVMLHKVVYVRQPLLFHEWIGNHPDELLQQNETFYQADKLNYLKRKAFGFPKEYIP